MNYISPKKQRFVNFIKNFTNDNNRPPTFVEIMSGLSIKSLGTINWYVNELEKEGLLERIRGKNGKRALSVLEQNIQNRLPLLGLIAAGYPLETFENNDYINVPLQYLKPDNYVLKVNGDSMKEDGILDGDYIIVEKNNIAKEGDNVVAIINGEATLKSYYIGSNGIELHPRNDKYGIIYVNEEDDFRIQGLLKGVFRKY